ncbi:hypothetical protein D3C84_330190 [compost metagenome]
MLKSPATTKFLYLKRGWRSANSASKEEIEGLIDRLRCVAQQAAGRLHGGRTLIGEAAILARQRSEALRLITSAVSRIEQTNQKILWPPNSRPLLQER